MSRGLAPRHMVVVTGRLLMVLHGCRMTGRAGGAWWEGRGMASHELWTAVCFYQGSNGTMIVSNDGLYWKPEG
jgi:hypothetical protein